MPPHRRRRGGLRSPVRACPHSSGLHYDGGYRCPKGAPGPPVTAARRPGTTAERAEAQKAAAIHAQRSSARPAAGRRAVTADSPWSPAAVGSRLTATALRSSGRGTAVRRSSRRKGGPRGHSRPRRLRIRPGAGPDRLRRGRGHRCGGRHLHRRARAGTQRRLRARPGPARSGPRLVGPPSRRTPLVAALHRLAVPCAVRGERARPVGVHRDGRIIAMRDK